MKKIRNIIIIVAIIVVWIFLMSVFYKEKEQLKKEEIPQYLILDGHFFWEYKNKRWTDLAFSEEYDLFNWKKFDIFIDNNYYNTYKYVFNNYTSYMFDDDEISQNVPDNYFLINEGSFLSMIRYNEVEFTDTDHKIALNFLGKNDIFDQELKVGIKYVVGENEFIYVVSNYEDTLINEDIYYIVFYRRGNKNYLVAKGDYEFNYNLFTVINVGNKFNNFILSYDCDGICYRMFQYNDGNYVNVLE